MRIKKIKFKSLFAILAVCMLYVSILPLEIGFMKYVDDLIPLLFGIIWLYALGKRSIPKTEVYIFILLCIICVIGLISNAISGIGVSSTYIILDLYSFIKMFLVFLGTWALLGENEIIQKEVVRYLSGAAKCFILMGAICGVLNFAGLIDMYENTRFGLRTFSFLYGNASQYGILVGVALAFVIFANDKHLRLYELLGLMTMILTMKGMALIIVAVYVCLNLLKNKKLKIWQLCLACIVLMFVLRYQIATYLLNEYAPRAILLRYGAVTANSYFPFGAGFATYGSEMAARYYSPLYVLYGFAARKSLTYGTQTALNDVYLGMSLGEFGWIGTVLLLIIFGIIGEKLLRFRPHKRKKQNICIALYACLCGMAIMAGSIKGTPGQLMLFTIALSLAEIAPKQKLIKDPAASNGVSSLQRPKGRGI